jgi:hypothetical protein
MIILNISSSNGIIICNLIPKMVRYIKIEAQHNATQTINDTQRSTNVQRKLKE